jgi:sulfopropanediol 3-dehydrogenase
MTIRHLKTAKTASDRNDDDAKVRATVEAILTDIEARGDAAVRELSQKFDSYAPAAFRLSASEIEALLNRVSTREMEDIKFAQAQVRKFAEAQRGSMLDVEIETMPGVVLGHKNIPVQSAGCYVPGRQVPDGGVGAYVGADGLGGRRAAYHRRDPAVQGRAQSGGHRGDASGRRA